MRIKCDGAAILAEARNFQQLVEQDGHKGGLWQFAQLNDSVELTLQDNPHPLFAGPCQAPHQGVVKLLEFVALQEGSDESIQVQADYEFLKDGTLCREVHEQAWSGKVVMATRVDPSGRVLEHTSNDGLSPESKAILEEWNISY